MKILILGVTGMLGSALSMYLRNSSYIDVHTASRSDVDTNLLPGEHHKICLEDGFDDLLDMLSREKFDVVVNCIGYIKQRTEDIGQMYYLNAALPHALAAFVFNFPTRLICISTDCVFDGTAGSYNVSDVPNAKDHYGISKILGEKISSGSLIIRTSIIGHELYNKASLLEWFLNSENEVSGYAQALYSGVTTLQLSKFITRVIVDDKNLSGLIQYASTKISKFELLKIVREQYKKNINIIEDNSVQIDRSLVPSQLSKSIHSSVPDWEQMIFELHKFYVENYSSGH